MNKTVLFYLLTVPGVCLQAQTTAKNTEAQQEFSDQSFFSVSQRSMAAEEQFDTLVKEREELGMQLALLAVLQIVNQKLDAAFAENPGMTQEEFLKLKNSLLDENEAQINMLWKKVVAQKAAFMDALENDVRESKVFFNLLMAAARPGSTLALPEELENVLRKNPFSQKSQQEAVQELATAGTSTADQALAPEEPETEEQLAARQQAERDTNYAKCMEELKQRLDK